MKNKSEYYKLMLALNTIDEQADMRDELTPKEVKARAKAYTVVADFISKYAEK